MTTNIVKPVEKENCLSKEIKPFIKTYDILYQASYCLFSQYSKYELLNFYTTWNLGVSSKKDSGREVIELFGGMISYLYSLILTIDKIGNYEENHFYLDLEVLIEGGLESAITIDKFMAYEMNHTDRNPEDLRCANLTKMMFQNYYLFKTKGIVLEYEI